MLPVLCFMSFWLGLAFSGQLLLNIKNPKANTEIVQNRVGKPHKFAILQPFNVPGQSYNYDALRFSCPPPQSYHVVLLVSAKFLHLISLRLPKMNLRVSLPRPLHNCALIWFYDKRSG